MEPMSREQKKEKQKKEKGSHDAEKIVVAVKASKEIPKTALVWALTHIVQPGDCITLIVVIPSQSSGMSFSSLHFWSKFCTLMLLLFFLYFWFELKRRLASKPRFCWDFLYLV